MLETGQKNFQKRQIAYKLSIYGILSSIPIKDNFFAGSIRINGYDVSRVNVIATVVYKSEQSGSYSSMLIDDGTGRISLRSFENWSLFQKADVGDVVLVIGKVREFNNEKYITPEILKKIKNFEWFNVRKKELESVKILDADVKIADKHEEKKDANDSELVYSMIKRLDKGDGVSFEDVIRTLAGRNAEEMINKLLCNGDVFEVKPGKLKVLD